MKRTNTRKTLIKELAAKKQYIDLWPSEEAKDNLAEFAWLFAEFRKHVFSQLSAVGNMSNNLEAETSQSIRENVAQLHQSFSEFVQEVNRMSGSLMIKHDNDAELKESLAVTWPLFEEAVRKFDTVFKPFVESLQADPHYNGYLNTWIRYKGISVEEIQALLTD